MAIRQGNSRWVGLLYGLSLVLIAQPVFAQQRHTVQSEQDEQVQQTSLPSFQETAALSLSSMQQDWICLSPDQPVSKWSAAEVKRLMNIFSWKNFIAANWPIFYTDGSENGLDKEPGWQARRTAALVDQITKNNLPRWMIWQEAEQILAEKRVAPATPDNLELAARLTRTELVKQPGVEERLRVYDLNGKPVYYEIRINPPGLKYIQDNVLDTIEGQEVFAKKYGDVFFQGGQCQPYGFFNIEGVIETKLAWKILGSGDIPERFLRRTVTVQNSLDGRWQEVEVGLVGMHLAHKTRDYMKWVWSTFEHIDNVRSNPLPGGGVATPSFFDPECPQEACPVNCPPAGGGSKSQLTRTTPLAEDVAALNAEMQGWLKAQGSVLQYYELVETQYVPIGADKPSPPFVRNTVMEPYMSQSQCDEIPPTQSSCIGCHNQAKIPVSICGQDSKAANCVSADMSFLITEARAAQAQSEQAGQEKFASSD